MIFVKLKNICHLVTFILIENSILWKFSKVIILNKLSPLFIVYTNTQTYLYIYLYVLFCICPCALDINRLYYEYPILTQSKV